MVCARCILAVEQVLNEVGIPYRHINLGEVGLIEPLDGQLKLELESKLESIGFSLIDDRKSRMIEHMKRLIIEKIHHSTEELHVKWAELITEGLHYDYKYLSALFSSVEGITLEQYIIKQKIERVKELMIYDELTLSQIAIQMGYSSVAHLSGQFKKLLGMTPSQFKTVVNKNRKALDDIR